MSSDGEVIPSTQDPNSFNSNGQTATDNDAMESGLQDYIDATGISSEEDSSSHSPPRSIPIPVAGIARMPVYNEAIRYNMGHARRGVALIFNHKKYNAGMQQDERTGTDADRENLRVTLLTLGFEVRIHDDLPYMEINRLLLECSKENHSDADCLLVCVLSHGKSKKLYASDQTYKTEKLWTYFSADRCPTLAGKPKLFFIQACQGNKLDSGTMLTPSDGTGRPFQTDWMDSKPFSVSANYKIPNQADFLIAYSTADGYFSWRRENGSWFIRSLCKVLREESASKDLLSMMTTVSRRVVLDFQSKHDTYKGMKQIPCVSSMLMREVYFVR